MFPAHSIELKVAIAVCALSPYMAAVVMYRLGKLWPLNFGAALFLLVLFSASFVAIAFIRSPLPFQYTQPFPPEVLVNHALSTAAFVFPGMPLLIVLSILALVSWKSDARYLFLALSGFGHAFFLVNIMMFMADIDLIRI